MLTVQNLSLKTRQPILHDFSYQFAPGQFYQIAAENGSGKTSFLRAVTDLIPASSGKVLLDGKPYAKNKRKLFFFESNEWLNVNLTSLDYLKFVKSQWHSNVDLDQELDLLGVREYVKVPIKKYSLGMKQKLIVAMYLVSDAEYYLMDEITNGLDEESRTVLYERLNDEVTQRNKCIILTSHYSSEIKVNNLHRLVLHKQMMHEVEQ
ncbi:ABC superfamily ATP binding cassette transporter, ABC protein [Lactobacillus kimbladii]|uniref:ABC superfamily ATP binding cassette transporter, ABC protein n=2 Tax=Lactobacillus kimbladii TaxID=1218506 RepID=A0A0F4LG77_9LACO|nr:ABC superfamily ATP binding cassette transporter, ABC protein [Lactobacillus kimbladii]